MYTRVQACTNVSSTSDLVDVLTGDVRSCDVDVRSYAGRTRFAGPARTIRCRGDNVLVEQVLSQPGNGGVLVVDGGGSLHTALVGDVIAGIAVSNGWSGLLLLGALRDVTALRSLPLGVMALGTTPRKSAKVGHGVADIAVAVGNVTVAPGDYVFSDEDGVLVLSAEEAHATPPSDRRSA